MPFECEQAMTKLIVKELKLHGDMERLKEEIASRYDYSVDSLYKEVDDWNYNYIDFNNLKRFILKMGVAPTDALLVAILRRFDLDADAKLTYQEFSDGIKPVEEYSKKGTK